MDVNQIFMGTRGCRLSPFTSVFVWWFHKLSLQGNNIILNCPMAFSENYLTLSSEWNTIILHITTENKRPVLQRLQKRKPCLKCLHSYGKLILLCAKIVTIMESWERYHLKTETLFERYHFIFLSGDWPRSYANVQFL